MNFFITNREIIEENTTKEYIREDGCEKAGDNLRFGTYSVSSKKFKLYPEPDNDADLLYKNITQKTAKGLRGSSRFFKTLYDNLSIETKRNDVLFFIHGFNTDLDGVRENFKTLHNKYVVNKESPIEHIVIFTWPGRSPLLPIHYCDDKKDAIRSGESLARGFGKLISFFRDFLGRGKNAACNQNIHLMAHWGIGY